MESNQKAEIFAQELSYIKNIELRERVKEFISTKVPDYFFEAAASSSGKYHPSFAAGEGGLVRHTKMVVAVMNELINFEEFNDIESDCMIASCIIHDTFKHGDADSGYTVDAHPVIAAEAWRRFDRRNPIEITKSRIIYNCVANHQAKWGPECVRLTNTNDSEYCKLVQYADYIASRKFFDMFKEEK